jgi:transcriptional regulator with XRE-family HTH domain
MPPPRRYTGTMMSATSSPPVGMLLRQWRNRRRRSQLDLALDADISQRHLSFVESGRSLPSRETLLVLAEHLDVPLRERNALLLAAGYAPVYPERGLDSPELAGARQAILRILDAHEPFPALAVDLAWTMVAANAALAPLLEGIEDPELLAPPVNVLRLSLHPRGLGSRIVNGAEWRHHVLTRLRHQVDATGDAGLIRLLDELERLPPLRSPARPGSGVPGSLPAGGLFAVPLRLETAQGTLSFLSTTTVFGAPMDVTLAELAIEAFYPADEATAEAMTAAAAARKEAR